MCPLAYADDTNDVKKWQSEDEIKAQLRELTADTRKLRTELNDLVRNKQTRGERPFPHEPPASSNDGKRKKAR